MATCRKTGAIVWERAEWGLGAWGSECCLARWRFAVRMALQGGLAANDNQKFEYSASYFNARTSELRAA